MKPKRILKLALTPRCSFFHACSSGGIALAGAAFLGASFALADESWDGDVGTDWNTAANWTNDSFPTGAWAILNTTGPNIATITTNSVFTPSDIQVGMSTNGRLDHVGGTAQTGPGNWMSVGFQSGGIGTYNLADTSGSGGTLTGFATGSGTMNAQSNLMIGRDSGVGTVNVNTSGQLNISSDMRIGTGGGTGTLNIDAGIVVTNNWTTLGGGGSSGTVNLSGGELRKQGGGNLIVADNGTGTFNQAGGIVSCNSEFWIGQGGTSSGEYNLSAGTLATSAWAVIGRDGGTGEMNVTGGTWNHTPGGQHIVIAASGTGTVNLGSGLIHIPNAAIEVGENGTAFLTVSGSGELRTQAVRVGMNTGSNGTLTLNGGTVRTGRISGLNRGGTAGDGTSSAVFNGSQIIATRDDAVFLTSFDSAVIQAGGLLVDSDGFTLAGDQAFSGTGGVVKSGDGSLSLLGGHSYSGANTVEAGKLTLPNHATGTGDIQVDAGASLGIGEVIYDSQISSANVTFDAASTMDISFTDLGGSIPTNAPLNVTTNLALGGDLTINVSDIDPETGTLPLIAYAAKSGAGTPVLGLLPENVTGTLQDNGSLISIDITASQALAWDGDISGQWDFSATNWYDEETSTDDVPFVNDRWVNFDDLATGTTDVILDTVTVEPTGTLFENDTLDFTLGGSGSIGGSGRLIKRGAATAAIGTANTYTGFTRIEEGVLEISSVANGGAASAVGASSAAPENLVLAGGTLSFTGASGSSDRGFRVEDFGSTISVDNTLGFGGTVVAAPESNLTKAGAGSLTLSATGTNTYGNGTIPADDGGLVVDEGGLTLGGGGNHVVTGELQVATLTG
ncbi:MAG: autotransporter-associated beta strand repeat-containing protein, partial [Verrucomicrobiae bacterium]|nr:autotransporter-associated beta strand repeat-containing protein [Verrucomicrobiae bacterium]